jgi:hypothetical protein
VLIDPAYLADGPSRGPAITEPALSILTELAWAARLAVARATARPWTGVRR